MSLIAGGLAKLAARPLVRRPVAARGTQAKVRTMFGKKKPKGKKGNQAALAGERMDVGSSRLSAKEVIGQGLPYLAIGVVPSAGALVATAVNKKKIEEQEAPLSELDKALLIRQRMAEIGEAPEGLSPAEAVIAGELAKAQGEVS